MSSDLFNLEAYHYDLPQELIAQHPTTPRDHSRLMMINRQQGTIGEIKFHELKDFLKKGDSLVFNDTKVIPARLMGIRETGGQAEILLIKRISLDTWQVMARPGKKLREGAKVYFGEELSCHILETTHDGGKIVQFRWKTTFEEALIKYGRMPLPPYIRSGKANDEDTTLYQTVYAKELGAAAAPTAGLHFTERLIGELNQKDIKQTTITLHVGMGTFKPVQTQDIRKHPMHSEPYMISQQAADQLNKRDLKYTQICVGTTCCRVLESAADENGLIHPGIKQTSIFIYPGYVFKYTQALLTNFHLPGSSLLMLVSAFGGYELIKEAYQKAIKEKFRFYSYGDAMLIL